MAHPPQPTPKLRDAWARVLENSAAVDAEGDSMAGALRARMTSFEYLVRRYMVQIRYGCDNADCTTPTCFSCVKRATDKPVRRPSPLTARALAYHLASQDDPASGLCKPTHSTFRLTNTAEFGIEAKDPVRFKVDSRSLSQNLFNTRVSRTLRVSHSSEEQSEIKDAAGSTPLDEVRKDLPEAEPESRTVDPVPALESHLERLAVGPPPTTNGDAAVKHESKAANGSAVVHATGTLPEPGRDSLTASATQSIDGDSDSGKENALLTPPSDITLDGSPFAGSDKAVKSTPRAARKQRDSSTKPSTRKVRVPLGADSLSKPRSQSSKTVFATTHLTCAIMEDLKRIAMSDGSIPDTRTRDAIIEPTSSLLNSGAKKSWRIVDECLFRCLSNPHILLKSFREKTTAWTRRPTPLAHLDAWEMEHAFRSWQSINGSLIYDSLWYSLECLFTPPPELKIRKSSRTKRHAPDDMPKGRNHGQSDYVSDEEAAHIIMVCIHALTSLVTRGKPNAWKFVRGLRPFGWISPNDTPNLADNQTTVPYTPMWLMITDQLEYEPALRLATRLVRAIGARRCFFEMLKKTSTEPPKKSEWAMTIVCKHLVDCERYRRVGLFRAKWDEERVMDTWSNWTIAGTFVEWLKTIVMKNWTGQHELKRWDATGAAAEILSDLYDYSNLNIHRHMYELAYFKYKLDTTELINSYLGRKNDPNYLHILYFPFFFPSGLIVQYFRALNFSVMSKHYTTAGNNYHLQDRFSRHFLSDQWRNYLDQHYGTASNRYLSLDVRRSHVLEDTFDQLWGLEKRQLLLPLKVRVGKLEGEQGVDQGGVAQEFFRVALAEAFNPDNGMFTVDPVTHVTWFQPFSLEPLSRFELIGLLFSIAIYNGITLPVTLPGALYLKLIGKTVRPHHISEGWPDLVKSFQFLLSCEDDVGDILSRGYEFSFEARGLIVNINMDAVKSEFDVPSPYTMLDDSELDVTPSTSNPTPIVNWPPGTEAPLVTNANRERFVCDYVAWLTDKSIRPQYEAFARGFHRCIPEDHLQLLRPSLLQHIVEGSTEIDTHALERVARYDGGFDAQHPFVRTFWEVVHAMSQEQKRKLLEFVTASDRVPVAGVESVVFWVQRNGPDGEGLPTSSTCFGRLLLPEYDGKEKLEKKLAIALENSRGFGAA
ncbi:hect domain-containing protein [Diplodia corticola]|uniref:HECT-type E3 ubiquitin transferase n=1 Tax=Diplodia corticola TaxID=236234 RepID=A0A1J9S7W2_9PEZI|nr:hect domain-containing protein [Diplodia corticola]OJD36583.1 hect domain-containing protein [Diplodia corticola]